MKALYRALTCCGPAALATSIEASEIYRCKVDGVTTYVDSPTVCKDGVASRPDVGATHRQPKQGTRASAQPGLGRAESEMASGSSPARCESLSADPARLRQCVREQRRAQVRQIATGRFLGVSRAVSDLLHGSRMSGNVIAASNGGRGPAWCEDVLGDVVTQSNFEVVDDESIATPRWIDSGNAPGRRAAEVLDADFRSYDVPGGPVADGYVTVRWRTSKVLVLRVMAACTTSDAGTAHCNRQRHSSVFVYDDDAPIACQIMAVGQAYWANWKNTNTAIFVSRPLPVPR